MDIRLQEVTMDQIFLLE